MTIAQRYASDKAAACPRTLPLELINARAAAFDPLNCLDLGITARRVLFGILAFFNISRPAGSIWPRRDRLRAESLLNSESSLYRGLNDLESKGYVSREQIRIAQNGRFHISPIHLTEKALVLLGLKGGRKQDRQRVIHNKPSVRVEDGLYKEHTNNQKSLQKSVPGETASEIDRSTRLPVALLWLAALGLTPRAVFSLMGVAKEHGKRLQDVAEVCRGKLSALSAREAFAYLRKLLQSNRDFRTVASACKASRLEADARKSALSLLDGIMAKCDGLAVYRADGLFLGMVSVDAAAVVSRSGSLPLNLRFALAVQEGKVRVGRME